MSISKEAKTVVLGSDFQPRIKAVNNGVCPVCNTALQETEDPGKLRCPVCHFTKIKMLDFHPGTILKKKYRILSSLNSGGCGDIFLCHPLDNAQIRYVVKILKNANLPELQQRFAREAALLQSISDERIVKLIDHWNDASGSFIILEYINGKTLHALRDEYDFDEESVLLVGREVASALQLVWDNFSIIHRDIKPENIMLDQNNQVKLLDFGLSKDTGSETTDITMDHAGLGTPGYMSPEQFLDFKHADFRSDIFSLGATMFLLLTGEKPFDGKTTQDIYEDTLRNAPPPKERLQKCCSSKCLQLIQWMMQKNPDDRPHSYNELLAKIDSLLAERGITYE